ncbi:hypothetical protein CPB85DRAFT_1438422 [Mucidula mucida]|nr:hypothetical protein CPB85DRAFT_1438422 [Mucidula mucida]
MVSLDSTFGAAYMALSLLECTLISPSLFLLLVAQRSFPRSLHGVTCVQALYYYLHQTDSWGLKGIVTAVMVLDTIHQALISHTVYTYVITNYFNPAALADTVWSLLLEVLFNGFTALLVQGFLTMRVWHLSSRNIWLTGLVSSFVIGEFGCVVVFAVYALFHVHTFEELGELKALSITVNALAACGDITITTALVCLLAQSRPRFANSRRMIKMLIIYSINTGLITTLCAIASLVSILAWGHTFIYITFFFCIGRLYSNSLLATLNARKRIRASGEGVNTTSDNQGWASPSRIFLRNRNPVHLVRRRVLGALVTFDSSLMLWTKHPTNISIKIDTTKEFATDDGGMANNEKDNDDSGSSKDSLTFREMIHETTGSKEVV